MTHKILLSAVAMLLLFPAAAGAVLHVELGDPRSNGWTVTYRFSADEMGQTYMDVLPYEAEIEIVEIAPERGGRPFEWERINEGEERKPKIRVKFPKALGPGESQVFRLVAHLKDPNAYFMDTAKLNFLYRTGHEINVSLPPGYYPVYTDEPMEIKQERGRIVLISKGGRVRPIVVFAIPCAGEAPTINLPPARRSTAPSPVPVDEEEKVPELPETRAPLPAAGAPAAEADTVTESEKPEEKPEERQEQPASEDTTKEESAGEESTAPDDTTAEEN